MNLKQILNSVIFLFKPQKDGSLPVSVFLRRIFESSFFKPTFGVWLVSVFLILGRLTYPSMAFTAEEAVLSPPTNISLVTETNFQIPLLNSISQYYHWYHPGIDIIGFVGQPIYPVDQGQVIEVEYQRWGYGYKVLIDHQNGFKSLYAHLNSINVQPGQQIGKQEAVASVGLTGWTTGPHLHLEIWQNDKPIDPITVLPDFNTL